MGGGSRSLTLDDAFMVYVCPARHSTTRDEGTGWKAIWVAGKSVIRTETVRQQGCLPFAHWVRFSLKLGAVSRDSGLLRSEPVQELSTSSE